MSGPSHGAPPRSRSRIARSASQAGVAHCASTSTTARTVPQRSNLAAPVGPGGAAANLISRYRSATGGVAHEILGSFRIRYRLGRRITFRLQRIAANGGYADTTV